MHPSLSIGCYYEPVNLGLLHLVMSWNVQCFSTMYQIIALCNTTMYAFSQLHHDNEVPQWNNLHLLKLSIRSAVQLMKLPGSKPFFSRTLLSLWGNSSTARNASQHFPLIVELESLHSLHHVNSLVIENHACKLHLILDTVTEQWQNSTVSDAP